MSDTALIVLDRQALQASMTGDAARIRELALDAAAPVVQVETPEDNEAAAKVHAMLGEVRKNVEKARKAAKDPFLQFGKNIDAIAANFVAEIIEEEQRISGLIGNYRQVQEARRQAAERAARLEQERIEREAREEQMRILREQAERERKEREAAEALERKAKAEADEAARKIADAKNAEARARAVKEAEIKREQAEREAIELRRQQELAAAQTHAQLDAAQERASTAQAAVVVAPVAPVPKGQNVVSDWEITISDIEKLYRAHRNCVKVEPIISEIKALLRMGVTVHGVTAKPIMRVQSRTTGQRVIEI